MDEILDPVITVPPPGPLPGREGVVTQGAFPLLRKEGVRGEDNVRYPLVALTVISAIL